ncbi:MAG TPA: GNAT family N-acetyltransferase [Streptosporangiaceae bacterium]
MQITSLGYLTDLAIRRAEGAETADRGDYVAIRSPGNPGYWWGNFLLLAAPAPGPRGLAHWLGRFEAEFPGARHQAFGLDVTAATAVDPEMFLAAGFQPESNVVLTARSVRPARPPDLPVVIRPLAGDEDWQRSGDLRRACAVADEPAGDVAGDAVRPGQANVAEAEAAQAGAERQAFEERKLAGKRRLTEQGHGAWLGAFAGDTLVAQLGVVAAGHGLARYQDVETHPGYRRLGLAGALVTRAAEVAVTAFGAGQLVIVADPGYHAIRLYQSLGFTVAQDQVGFVRPP